MGRPSTYTPEIEAEICRRISEGQTLRSICRDDHMPHWTTVYDWIAADDKFSLRIARARDSGFDAIAEECIDIADESVFDSDEDDEGRISVNHEVIQRSKLRVETRIKLLSKWSPKKYGERIAQEHSGPNGGPIQSVLDVSGLPTDVLAQIMAAKDAADKA